MLCDKPQFNQKLPPRINRLEELAFNLLNLWSKEARELWRIVDYPLWSKTNHNPVEILKMISKEKLEKLANDPSFLLKYDSVMYIFDKAWKENNLWFNTAYPQFKGKTIAYLSSEFAIHQSLPIYSGGLGVLSGDHCKEASDIGLPFIAIGLLVNQGYFTQTISPEGDQIANYENINFDNTALHPLIVKENRECLLVNIPIANRNITVKIWHLQVGRTILLLLDTDLKENDPSDRELSHRLYDNDRDLRLRQEYILGIGGILVLRALNIYPSVYHINEGHSALSTLELIREKMERENINFIDAVNKIRKQIAFTTHTPVPAGHETFSFESVSKYFEKYWNEFGISKQEFLELGAFEGKFNLTQLAIKTSGLINGVSQLNADIMNIQLKGLWSKVYEKPPIIGITNGVHVPSWIPGIMNDIFKKYISKDWLKKHDDPLIWEKVHDIPDRELWKVRQQLKGKMITFIRERNRSNWQEGKLTAKQAIASGVLLNPDVLTIGFARRFAPYKRATLIFRDLERIKKIINDPYRPVQIIFAGKSHPANVHGIKMIKELYQKALNPDFSGRVVFLEDYGLNIARFLVQGVDVWLNTPRRPNEASGTSGQKAAMNGVPNLSVSDGWWAEGYTGNNGWIIGDTSKEFSSNEEMDEFDANSLYDIIEKQIVPLYYDSDSQEIPRYWLEVVRESIKNSISNFSTRRMLKEYVTRMYNPLQD